MVSVNIGIIIVILIFLIWFIFSRHHNTNIYDRYDYFDYAATTPPYNLSLELGYLGSYQGNLSQFYNSENRLHVQKINDYILNNSVRNRDDYSLIWTSGASESNNTIIKTFSQQGRIIIGNTEHHTSMACIEDPVIWKDNNTNFIMYDFRDLQNLYNTITPDTKLISIMHINNETGYIYPIREIYSIVQLYRKNNNTMYPYLHSDMSQSFGKIYNPCPEIDIISASAHKFYGPLGSGIIIHKKNIKIQTMIYGTQQGGVRGGTTNYPAILSTAQSFSISLNNIGVEISKAKKYREEVMLELMKNFKYGDVFSLDCRNAGDNEPIIGFYPNSSPYILSFSILTKRDRFNNIKFKDRLLDKNIIIGTGSACSLGSSTTLNNLGLSDRANQGFIRISFGRLTTDQAVNRLKKELVREIKLWFQ